MRGVKKEHRAYDLEGIGESLGPEKDRREDEPVKSEGDPGVREQAAHEEWDSRDSTVEAMEYQRDAVEAAPDDEVRSGTMP